MKHHTENYIGLSKEALLFKTKLIKEGYRIKQKPVIESMFYENKIYNGIYAEKPLKNSYFDKEVYEEVLQLITWERNGPTYLTCLEYYKTKDGVKMCNEVCFEWVLDPNLEKHDFDKEKGHFLI